MINKEILRKKIIYRSTHRGSKEMDLLLGNFVKKNIDKFDTSDLADLDKILFIADEHIYKWYFNNTSDNIIPKTKVSSMLKKFRL